MVDTLSRLIEMDETIKLHPEEEGKEFRYFPFEELPPVTTQVVDEVIECEIGNINIQHADQIQVNIDITLPMKDEKLIKLIKWPTHTATQKAVEKQQPGQKCVHHGERHPEKESHGKWITVHTNSSPRHPKRLPTHFGT